MGTEDMDVMYYNDVTCGQCHQKKGNMKFSKVTCETTTVCLSCGYISKAIIKEDKVTTKKILDETKKLFAQRKYKTALVNLGYAQDNIQFLDTKIAKDQVSREIQNPSRYPLCKLTKNGQIFEYDHITKEGFGTYSYQRLDGVQIFGRFASEKHRTYLTKTLTTKHDLDTINSLKITYARKDEITLLI